MGYVRRLAPVATEPVSLAWMKNFLRVDSGNTQDDQLISGLISAAREHGEKLTGRALARGTFRMTLDSHPYYTDTVQSQLAYPPSYYSLPRYSTTLWNYSQMIKIWYPPTVSVEQMRYIDTNGDPVVLAPYTGFILDRDTEPARIFPIAGQFWPADLYVPNAVEIDFTAGYDPNPAAAADLQESGQAGMQPDSTLALGVPHSILRAIMVLVAHWYEHRSEPSTQRIDELFYDNAIVDFAPTRG